MKAEDVARYLQENPVSSRLTPKCWRRSRFRIRTAAARFRSPTARCWRCARKARRSRRKLAELIQFGEENDAIGEKMHRLCLALLAARDSQRVLPALYYNLREDFAVPHVGAARLARTTGSVRSGVRSGERRADAATRQAWSIPTAAPSGQRRGRGLVRRRRPRTCARWPACRCATQGLLRHAGARRARTRLRFYPEMGTLYLQAPGRAGERGAAAIR